MPLKDLIPHAPQVGLYVAPQIPEKKLENALEDYAKTLSREDVIALFDATLMGSAKDGAVFTRNRMVFQNNDLQPIQEVRYEDIVQVDARRKLIGGRRIVLTVNRGRATFEVEMDFSGKPQAADFVLRFLREAMLQPGGFGADTELRSTPDGAISKSVAADAPAAEGKAGGHAVEEGAGDHPAAEAVSESADDIPRGVTNDTDVQAVAGALEDLRNRGLLSARDFEAMINLLER